MLACSMSWGRRNRWRRLSATARRPRRKWRSRWSIGSRSSLKQFTTLNVHLMKRQLQLSVLGLVAFAPTLVLAQQPDAAAPAAPLKSDDPSVQALLDTKPSTPADLLN